MRKPSQPKKYSSASPAFPEYFSLGEFVEAIAIVETGKSLSDPTAAQVSGDKGASIGPLQIQIGYCTDAWLLPLNPHAVDAAATYGGINTLNLRQINNLRTKATNAVKTFLLWQHRYSPEHLLSGLYTTADLEIMARRHNGGPDGDSQDVTRPYWEKVLRVLRGEGK